MLNFPPETFFVYIISVTREIMQIYHINNREPLKTGVKSKNGQGVPASRKADEVRLPYEEV